VTQIGIEFWAKRLSFSPAQAQQLKEAGVTAYNHNLDTSREFYGKVIWGRKYSHLD
jgi:biotin synthase